MKKGLVLLLVLLVLSGCSAPVWETVEDIAPAVPTASMENETYTIEIGVPSSMKLLEAKDGWHIFSTDHGEFEVETRTFLASGVADAVKTLSGYSMEQLTVLETERFDLPEYQFVWLTQTEQGTRLCRADLVVDGMECYAVVCSTMETAGDLYEKDIRRTIATFGLFTDEGV